MAAVSALEIMAFAMSADGFITSIITEWDRFKTIATEHAGGNSRLAQELLLFTDPEARAELEFDLQFSQTAIRTHGRNMLPAKLGVAAEFKKAFDTLNVLSAAIEAIKGNHAATYGAYPAQPALRVLKSHVAVFEEACARFHQRLMPIRAHTPATAPLVPDDLQFECAAFDTNEKKPAIEQIGETCFQQEVVYTPPQATEKTTRKVLLEKRPYTGDKMRDSLLKEAREVAKRLGLARRPWNIPELIGYRDEPTGKAIELVFERPNPNAPAKSLWDCYYGVGASFPEPLLNIRVHLCRQLANAVAQAHRIGLLHGDIRPRNVVVTYDQSPVGEMLSGSLYLVGWSNLGHPDNTLLAPHAISDSEEMTAPRMLYQHPNQWATTSAENKKAYDMGNDIYSLGVCMVEILLWEPLFSNGSPSSLFEALFSILGHKPGVSTSVAPVAPTRMLNLIESVKASIAKKRQMDEKTMDEKTAGREDMKNDDSMDEKKAMAVVMRNYSYDDKDIEEIRQKMGKSLAERHLETPAGIKQTIEQMAHVYVAKKAGDRMSRMVFRCLTPPPYFSNEQNPNLASLGQTNRLVQAFYDDMFDDFNMVLAAL